MKDKWLMIGVGTTFLAFFLMIVSMMMLSRHSEKNKELLKQIPATPQEPVAIAQTDFSLYKTIVGDDGREMIEIPEGPFKMGSKDGDYDEAPEHQIYLSTYYMDKYEVTQAEYERFVKMTKRGKPFVPVFDDDPSKILKPELAAMGMSWSDATAYCQWAGKRLPTEAEWEKAAKGEGNRKYPWGDTLTPKHANLDGEESTQIWTARKTATSTWPLRENSRPDAVTTGCMIWPGMWQSGWPTPMTTSITPRLFIGIRRGLKMGKTK